MKTLALIAATAVIVAATSSSAAQFVVNGNFTDLTNGLGQLNNGSTTAVGWSTVGYSYVMNQADVGSSFTLFDSANYTTGPTGVCGSTTCNPVGNSWNGLAATTGNFVAMDGDYITHPLTQTITGLTVGKSYALSFYYAFGQQTGFNGDTIQSITESLGGQTFTSADFNVASHGFTGWQLFTTTITASATSEVLSFLATGNLPVPPFAMISDVSLTSDVPEPASWALMIVGMGGIGAMARRRRAGVAA